MDERVRSIGGMVLKGEPKYRERIPTQCHFVHHKSYMHWPGIELKVNSVGKILRRVNIIFLPFNFYDEAKNNLANPFRARGPHFENHRPIGQVYQHCLF